MYYYPVSAVLTECLILSVVEQQDSYGYEISQTVKMVASIKESTLYPILRKLETGGYLTTYSEEFQGRKRKYYSITEAGREQLEYLRKEWREYRDTIDDIVEGIQRIMHRAPERRAGEDGLPIPPYAIYNIGNSHPEKLLDFVQILQEELMRADVLPADYDFESHKELVPMQPGDVPITYADTTVLQRDFGFRPSTTLREGLRKFAEWYKDFYCQ